MKNLTPKTDLIVKILIAFGVFFLCVRIALGQDSATTAKVTRIIDGDTFDCVIGSDTMRIRVLNLDTYETRMGKRLEKQARRNNITLVEAMALGRKAKAYAEYLLHAKTVRLSRKDGKQPDFDIYGRMLRYVEVNGLEFDQLMIEKGYDSR